MAVDDPAFLADLGFVLAREGGLVDNPHDPGGRTNRGVTQRVYDRWRRQQQQPTRDVAQIAQEELRAIYYAGYYSPLSGVAPPVLRLIAFDTAVNMGLTRAIRWTQMAMGTPGNPRETFLHLRQQEYRAIVRRQPVLQEFLPGWLFRLRVLRRYLQMAPDPTLDQQWQAARA